MNFSLTMPGKVLFGRGELAKAGDVACQLGKRFLIVTNPSLLSGGAVERLLQSLRGQGVDAVVFTMSGEPTPDVVHEAAGAATRERCDAVIGMGGGSAMDAAKAAAGIATNGGPVVEYLEGVGKGRVMTVPPLPFLAIPTTAGTGSEATKNAVISDISAGYKASFRSDSLLAKAVIVDPELTVSVPANVTAWSGMDALTQLMESYLSKKAQPVTDALAISGMEAVAANLAKAYADGQGIEAREAMAYGSFLSGICLANAGLGADHGIAAAFGAVLGVPHGLACAVLLPHVMAFNLPHAGQKAAAIAQALTGRSFAEAADNAKAVTGFLRELSERLGIPQKLNLPDVSGGTLDRVFRAVSRSSMSGNPVEMTADETMEMISKAI